MGEPPSSTNNPAANSNPTGSSRANNKKKKKKKRGKGLPATAVSAVSAEAPDEDANEADEY